MGNQKLKRIRLTEFEISQIKKVSMNIFKENCRVWIFGSRTDPLLKGGDIDIYIETDFSSKEEVISKKLEFLVELKKKLGNKKLM